MNNTTTTYKPRVLFALWMVGGIKTVYDNLVSTMNGRSDIDAAWLAVEMHPVDWITRIPPIVFSGALRNSAATWLRIRRLQKTGKRFDAALFVEYGIMIFLWKFRRRVPYLLSLDMTPMFCARHELWYAHPRFHPSSPVARLKQRVTRSVFAGATHLLPWSHGVKESLIRDYGISEDRMTVLPPGIDLRIWTMTDADWEWRSAKRTPIKVLHAGWDFQRKGGDLMLELACSEEFRDVEFHFVTNTYEGPRQRNVIIHPSLSQNTPEIIALYREADIFALPTRADTYSLVCLEAMAMGLPVVISDVGGIQDIVVEGQTGYLIPRADREALRERLRALVASPELRVRMGKAGRRRVEQEYDLVASNAKILDLLLEASSRKRSN
jgi:glycosyltransferase involved in cell wall biosynthesis